MHYFLERVGMIVSAEKRKRLEPFLERLASVKPAPDDEMTLLSSFEGPMLDNIIEQMPDATGIDVISPFFEGEHGPGIFDMFAARLPKARGRLFVRAQTAHDNVLEVLAPQSKIRAALDSGRWSLHQVLDTWAGDEEDAPVRALHGKLVAIRGQSSVIAMVGSPNLTRAALQQAPPHGNVEMAVLVKMTARHLAALIPEHRGLAPEDVRWLERHDQEGPTLGLERWVDDAVYDGELEELSLEIAATAPPLTVTYEGGQIAEGVAHPGWKGSLHLGRSLEIAISDGTESVTIPFLIEKFAALPARGAARTMGIDEFLDVLGGIREAPVESDPHAARHNGQPKPSLSGAGGALPWRKLFRALVRIERELIDEAAFPRGIEFILRNPARLGGLRNRLDPAKGSHLTCADHAFAIHEIRRALCRARSAMDDHPTSANLINETISEIAGEFETYRKDARSTLRKQLNLLAGDIS